MKRFPHLRTGRRRWLALAWLWLPLIIGAQEQALQPLDDIRDTAQRFAEETLVKDIGMDATATVTVGAIDPRLRLSACAQPLDAFLPNGMQGRMNVTVGVRCGGAAPWTLYVPVRITATRPVIVLTRPLPRGSVLTAADIDVEIRDTGALGSGYFEDPTAVLGKVLTRPGSAGQILNPALLTGSVAVRRGQQVTLFAGSGEITVRMEGTALADGSVGERLRVKNNSSARIVEGIVREDGSVQIGP